MKIIIKHSELNAVIKGVKEIVELLPAVTPMLNKTKAYIAEVEMLATTQEAYKGFNKSNLKQVNVAEDEIELALNSDYLLEALNNFFSQPMLAANLISCSIGMVQSAVAWQIALDAKMAETKAKFTKK